jgi:hypothetical protein
MSDSVTLTFRKIVIEDFMTSVTLATAVAPVLGAGTATTVTPFVVAASDSAAAAAGVPVGAVYVNTSGAPYYLKARMS